MCILPKSAIIKYRCKPYKRIGNLIRDSKVKPSVMLHCNVYNIDFLSKDATYASISERYITKAMLR